MKLLIASALLVLAVSARTYRGSGKYKKKIPHPIQLYDPYKNSACQLNHAYYCHGHGQFTELCFWLK